MARRRGDSDLWLRDDSDDNTDDVFALERVDEWRRAPGHGNATCGDAGGNVIAAGTNEGFILTLHAVSGRFAAVPVPRTLRMQPGVSGIWVDPVGEHIIFSTTLNRVFTFSAPDGAAATPAPVRALIGEGGATAVEWNREAVLNTLRPRRGSADTTDVAGADDVAGSIPALVGTGSGRVFELHIRGGKAFACARLWPEKSTVQISSSGRRYSTHSAAPITGIAAETFPFRETTCWYIAVATPTRLYQFVGGSTWTSTLKRSVCANDSRFLELPSSLATSGLHMAFPHRMGYPRSAAVSMVWRVEPGLYVGDFRFNLASSHDHTSRDGKRISADVKTKSLSGDPFVTRGLVPHPTAPARAPPSLTRSTRRKARDSHPSDRAKMRVPTAVAVTEFHRMYLYQHGIVVTNSLSQNTVFSVHKPPDQTNGAFVALARDAAQGTLWAFSEGALFELTSQGETRGIWRDLARVGRFSDALSYAEGHAARTSKVRLLMAEAALREGQFQVAGECYSMLRPRESTFEEAAGVLVRSGSREALKAFLLGTLRRRLHPRDRSQLTLVATWTLQVMLDDMRVAMDDASSDASDRSGRTAAASRQISAFFKEFGDCLDRPTTQRLIQGYGFIRTLEEYCEISGDREWLVRHFADVGRARRAILVLSSHLKNFRRSRRGRAPFDADLMFLRLHALLEAEPRATIDILIRAADLLKPDRVMRALALYVQAGRSMRLGGGSPGTTGESYRARFALRYYKAVLYEEGPRRGASAHGRQIHNFVFHCCCAADDNETSLLAFLKRASRPPAFDAWAATQDCRRYGCVRGLVEVYRLFGMLAQAVETALRVVCAIGNLLLFIPFFVHWAQRVDLAHPHTRSQSPALAQSVLVAHERESIRARRSRHGGHSVREEVQLRKLWRLVTGNTLSIAKSESKTHGIDVTSASASVPPTPAINAALRVADNSPLRLRDIIQLLPPQSEIRLLRTHLEKAVQKSEAKVRSLETQIARDIDISRHIETDRRIALDRRRVASSSSNGVFEKLEEPFTCSLSGLTLSRPGERIAYMCGHIFHRGVAAARMRFFARRHPSRVFAHGGVHANLIKKHPRLRRAFSGDAAAAVKSVKSTRDWLLVASAQCLICGECGIAETQELFVHPVADAAAIREWSLSRVEKRRVPLVV